MAADGDVRALVERFYAAFARLDADTMAAAYAVDATFDDPVFSLRGRDRIGGMWRMLIDGIGARGSDVWRLDVSGVVADATTGRARWEPVYRFGPHGRVVHNVIDAELVVRDGAIVAHRDSFDVWRWSRQALGPAGVLLGWSPLLRARVRRQAVARLDRYLAAGGSR